MQKKNGISLIVLVITIIVMIILAGTIMIGLNNSGILKRSQQAVDDTNLQEIRNLAALKWSEVYLAHKGKATQQTLEKEVLAAMEEEKIDLTSCEIIVTTKGTTVNRVYYYSTLKRAIDDINNGIIGTNSSKNKTEAVAGIYLQEGNTKVALLKDVTETEKIVLEKDVTIELRGKTVKFEDCVGFDTIKGNGNKIYIDGNVEGSTISCETKTNSSCPIQIKTGNSVIIEGVTLSGKTEGAMARAISANEASNVQIKNCKVNITSTAVDKSTIGLYFGKNAKATISNCDINIACEGEESYGYGVYLAAGSEITATNCNIFADALTTSVNDTKSYSIGIRTRGNLTLVDSYVFGTHSGIETDAGSKTYMTGGTTESCGHGGFYFAHGASGEAYIEGVQIVGCSYKGKYENFENLTPGKYAFYIGASSDEGNYMTANLNNCNIDGYITMTSTYGGTHNTLRISNSALQGMVRIDDATHRLYVGKNCNITKEKIQTYEKYGWSIKEEYISDVLKFTDEVYAKP